MTSTAIRLDTWHLALAALLILIPGAISLGLGLGLEKLLAIASVRAVAQLLMVGYVLKWVFGLNNPWILGGVLLVMVALASQAAIGRSKRTYPSVLWHSFFTLACSGVLTTTIVTSAIISVRPFWQPQYLIPLLGMILGNSLTGVSLCLDTLLDALVEKRGEVEMELAHGATKWEAARGPLQAAVRKGMIPNLNAMVVAGIVSLPGMMTGQILSGADPVEAVKYQIVVVFMIAAGAALGCILIALLAYHRLFNDRHQLEPIIHRRDAETQREKRSVKKGLKPLAK